MRGDIRLIGIFAGLYAAQGITGSLVQTALPTAMRADGMRLDHLGLLSLLFLPWALKFLWAPTVDRRFSLHFGRRRSWIVPCQGGLIACMALAALLPPAQAFFPLLGLLLIVACLAATQDTATDALAIETLHGTHRRLAGATQVAGGYFGFVIATAIWLPLFSWVGWVPAMLALALALTLLSLPTLFAPADLETDRVPPQAHRIGVISALRRPEFRRAMLFIVIFQLGARLGIALMGPFLVDAGLSLPTIGWLKGIGGAVAGITGAVLGSLLLRRVAATQALVWIALGHAACFVALGLAAQSGQRDPMVIGALVLLQGCLMSLSFVALYTTMMSWCDPGQAATDFALLQSADAILAILCGIAAGWISQSFGHGANFAGAGAALILAALAASRFMPAAFTSSSTPRHSQAAGTTS